MSDGQRSRCLADFLRGIDLDQVIPRRSVYDPSDDDLLYFIEGTLSQEQRRALEVLLRDYPYSSDRVAIIGAALRDAGVVTPGIRLLRD